MQLTEMKRNHLSCVTHEGKVLVFGLDDDGVIFYTVRQTGFEDSALSDNNETGFENWKQLPLDASRYDQSVIDYESEKMVAADGSALLRSRYGLNANGDENESVTKTLMSAVKPISAMGHLYVFRFSTSGYILVNRFILDGIKNELVPKIEVRFRRSRQKYQPASDGHPPKASGRKKLKVDSLDFRDMNGDFFYEPTIELSFMGVQDMFNGSSYDPEPRCFMAPLLLPTAAHDRFRWHIFTCANTGTVDQSDPGAVVTLTSLAATEEGLFEVSDCSFEMEGDSGPARYFMPGISKRHIKLANLGIVNNIAATVYHTQSEVETSEGETQLLKGATRVMLTVPVYVHGLSISNTNLEMREDYKTAALSFGVAADGTLSQLNATPDVALLRDNAAEVLLPLNTLDEIKGYADTTVIPPGSIRKMDRGQEDKVQIHSSQTVSGLEIGRRVKISGTKSYDGHYVVSNVSDESFEIDAEFIRDEAGYWEAVEETESGLVFDNMVAGYERTEDGKLKIICSGHTIQDGDEIQVTGTHQYDGIHAVRGVGDDNSFLLDIGWQPGEVVNLNAIKRRGMRFDGDGDYIRTPPLAMGQNDRHMSHGATVSAWIYLDEVGGNPQLIAGQEYGGMELIVDRDGHVVLEITFSDSSVFRVKDPDPAPLRGWVHFTGVSRFDALRGQNRLYLCRNGVKVTPTGDGAVIENNERVVPTGAPSHLEPFSMEFDGSNDYVSVDYAAHLSSDAFTVSLWARPVSGGSGTRAPLYFRGSSYQGFNIYIDSGGNWKFWLGTGTTWVQANGGQVAFDQWTHLAATFDQGNLVFYVNGAAITTLENQTFQKNTSGDFRLGSATNQHYFDGRLADVRLWSMALEASQILEDRSTPLGGREEGLLGYWTLANTEAQDLSKWAHHGVLSGNPTPISLFGHSFDFQAVSLPGNASNYVTVAGMAEFPTDQFTIVAWIKCQPESGSHTTLLSYGNATTSDAFAIRNPDNLWVYLDGDDSSYSGVAIDDGQWHHLAITWRSSTGQLIFYLDGDDRNTQTFKAGTTIQTGGTWVFGQEQDSEGGNFEGDQAFEGLLGRVSIYNDCWNLNEVWADMHRSRITGNEPDLVASWVFEDGAPRDLGPNGYHGSMIGSFAIATDTPPFEYDSQRYAGAPVADAIHYPGGCNVKLADPVIDFTKGVTFETWVMYTDINLELNILKLGPSGDYYPFKVVLRESSGSALLEFHSKDYNDKMVCSNVPPAGCWFHVSVAMDGAGMAKLYINGKEMAQRQMILPPSGEMDNSYLGIGSTLGQGPPFTLAEPRLWSKALTREEIQTNIFQRISGTEPDLIGVWRWQDDTVKDISPNAGHGWLSGKPVQGIAPPALASPGTSRFLFGGKGSSHNLKGKISDVQIWDRARTDYEIKDSMHVRLQGNELDLVGNWRLGGIIPEENARLTPDFGANQYDAEVFGDTYVAARELDRACKSGRVVKYSNDDLLAVTQGATYIESFEFRVSRLNDTLLSLSDLQDADSHGNNIFAFSYWGKKSRMSKDKIPFPAHSVRMNAFEDLGQGWFKASCTFTVPEGPAMIRSFEISSVKGIWSIETDPPAGEWNRLEVRKHRMIKVSDMITRETFQERAVLRTITDPQENVSLFDLESAEQKVARLKEVVWDLAERLDIAQNFAKYQIELNYLTNMISGMETDLETATTRLNSLEADPLNYICVLRGKGSNKALDVYGARDQNGTNVIIWPKHSKSNQLWEMLPQEDDYYALKSMDSGKVLDVKGYGTGNGSNVYIWNYHGKSNQLWKIEYAYGEYFALRGQGSNKVLDVQGHSTANGANCIIWQHHGKSNQLWRFEKTKTRSANGKKIIEDARDKKRSLQSEISTRKSRKARLETLLAAAEDVSYLQQKLSAARQDLGNAQSNYNSLNTQLLGDIRQTQTDPQTMGIVGLDKRDLMTTGALLGFSCPQGGIQLFNSCEGNIHMAYFDELGRMRISRYDATADSLNASYQQWLPDALGACLDFKLENQKMALGSPLNPILLEPNNWTTECWFHYPSAVTSNGDFYDHNVLFSVDKGEDYCLAIKHGRRLGTVVDGFFHDAGLDLDKELRHGWHHMTAVAKNDATFFYIDGQQVGYPSVTKKYSVVTNGLGRALLPTFSAMPTGDLTLACWLRASSSTNIPLLEYGEYQQFSARQSNATSKFGIGNLQNLRVTINGQQSNAQNINVADGRWHHLAITWEKQNGYLNIYVDGQLAANQDQFQAGINIGSGRDLVIGGAADVNYPSLDSELVRDGWVYNLVLSDEYQRSLSSALLDVDNDNLNSLIQVAGMSLWNVARPIGEIKQDLYRNFTGTESGLVAYWTMKQTHEDGVRKLENLTNKNHFFKLDGEAEVKPLEAQCTSNIAYVGNKADDGAPGGRLCEARIWNLPLTAEEISINSKTRLHGNEPGLVAYYPMTEAEGSAARDHVIFGPRHGQIQNPGWAVSTAPIGEPDDTRTAMRFNGVDTYATIPYDSALQNDDLSVEAYFRVDSEANNHGIIASTSENQTGWVLTANNFVVFFTFWHNGTRAEVSARIEPDRWNHVLVTASPSYYTFYLNGVQERFHGGAIMTTNSAPLSIGGRASGYADDFFKGDIAEIRIWSHRRNGDSFRRELFQKDMRRQLRRNALGLEGYWRFDKLGDNKQLVDSSGNDRHGAFNGDVVHLKSDLPGERRDLMICEYSTVGVDPSDSTKRMAMMRRFLSFSNAEQETVIYHDQRIEELELKWIGNAQFKPTLLGYIEGPPPVPSENLTIEYDYNGASRVELIQSDEVAYSWNRSQDFSTGLDLNLFLGAGWGSEAGLGVETKITEGKAGARLMFNMRKTWSSSSMVRAESRETSSDRIELRGAYENDPEFKHLGARFVPKNVGYALVVSGLADVFITRLKRSKRMISYEVVPAEGVPLDVNTITFMINPAYQMNGSLDGLVGSAAADERFFRHVPEMREQYGSLYPASYLRVAEAYDLEGQIDRQDAAREAYFINFDATRTGTGAVYDQTADASEYDRYGQVDMPEGPDDGEEDDGSGARSEAFASASKDKKAEKKKAKKRKADIEQRYQSQDKQVEASAGFAAWQKRMENLQIRASKRNIVNTYVWDGDGGLRSEEQSFTNTVEHSVGGSTSLDFNIGADLDIMVVGFKFELMALATINMTQTMSKTRMNSRGFELRVNLDGLESKGITDSKDLPLQPGEKVDRYRFKSFYLDGNVDHFHDFFSEVVDPEWLMSNDEEARALRQAQTGKPNKAWRVLHRVTYVERPALMGFGRDLRPGDNVESAAHEALSLFDAIEQDNQALRGEMAEIKSELNKLTGKIDNLDA